VKFLKGLEGGAKDIGENMHYVYVLRSDRNGRLHIGHTGSLNRTLALHGGGRVNATKKELPFTIVYYEACTDKRDALKRESYLRGAYGQRFLLNRLSHFLSSTS
jgi:putative endonuclease